MLSTLVYCLILLKKEVACETVKSHENAENKMTVKGVDEAFIIHPNKNDRIGENLNFVKLGESDPNLRMVSFEKTPEKILINDRGEALCYREKKDLGEGTQAFFLKIKSFAELDENSKKKYKNLTSLPKIGDIIQVPLNCLCSLGISLLNSNYRPIKFHGNLCLSAENHEDGAIRVGFINCNYKNNLDVVDLLFQVHINVNSGLKHGAEAILNNTEVETTPDEIGRGLDTIPIPNKLIRRLASENFIENTAASAA